MRPLGLDQPAGGVLVATAIEQLGGKRPGRWFRAGVAERVLLRLATFRGTIASFASPLRKQARDAIERHSGATSQREVATLLRRHLQYRSRARFARLWPQIRGFAGGDRIEVEGLEHLDDALGAGKGAILVAVHYGYSRLIKPILRSHGRRVLVVGNQRPDMPDFPPELFGLRAFHARRRLHPHSPAAAPALVALPPALPGNDRNRPSGDDEPAFACCRPRAQRHADHPCRWAACTDVHGCLHPPACSSSLRRARSAWRARPERRPCRCSSSTTPGQGRARPAARDPSAARAPAFGRSRRRQRGEPAPLRRGARGACARLPAGLVLACRPGTACSTHSSKLLYASVLRSHGGSALLVGNIRPGLRDLPPERRGCPD